MFIPCLLGRIKSLKRRLQTINMKWLLITLFFMLTVSPVRADENALPGAAPYSKVLHQSLQAALVAKGADSHPRTEHLLDSGQPQFTNRLILENSPYLLQHAHNPVNWFPWGNEAFETARRENKPIFLSIGYSTCHWCHVMERESFEDIAIARLLNQHFISIKVDRERHPEVDEVYMTAVMMIAGHGGWPMSSFLTPLAKPFWGGTYFRPDTFTDLLKQVVQLWQQQPAKLIAQANYFANAVKQVTTASGQARQVGEEAIQQAVIDILARHDHFLGGFGDAPKFPQETWLLLLLETAQRGNPSSLAAVEKSLTAMAEGGIYDQIGGGFHRYATDDHWMTPHFEKMLYNQAHIARAYAIAYQLSRHPFYALVTRQTLDYVLREMTSPEGGFYSATDADSEGEEGLFFLWTPAQIRAVLDEADANFALTLYGVTEKGNFESQNILYLPLSLDTYAKTHGIPLPQLVDKIDRIRDKLRQARDKREAPLRDDKIITAWNGMMIATFALAADILEEPRYLAAAQRAANLIWTKLKKGPGELWRIYLPGSASIPAHQEDYAYFAEALLHLYDVSGNPIWLDRASEMAEGMLTPFWDNTQGGFFMNRPNDTLLITRPKSPADRAIPSGNAVAVRVLSLLATRTGIEGYRDKANATLNAFSAEIAKQPSRYAYMLLAADELLHGEVGMRQYGARGAVKASASVVTKGQASWLLMDITIRDGWHINAHQPLQKHLIPTSLTLDESQSGWFMGSVDYPKPIYTHLSWGQSTLALYEETIQLRGRLIPLSSSHRLSGTALKDKGTRVPVKLKFQACDDKRCLPPEVLVFKVAVPESLI
ncbi:MAG TPA: thioredoxin domain-containing protein [Thiotrichaceae bacterium]|nr:thioredoxin domain-containing protein [Thiotrichaceae bacterium]